jgi:hypothetical protein
MRTSGGGVRDNGKLDPVLLGELRNCGSHPAALAVDLDLVPGPKTLLLRRVLLEAFSSGLPPAGRNVFIRRASGNGAGGHCDGGEGGEGGRLRCLAARNVGSRFNVESPIGDRHVRLPCAGLRIEFTIE